MSGLHCSVAVSVCTPPPLEWDGKLTNACQVNYAIIQTHHALHRLSMQYMSPLTPSGWNLESIAEITERHHVPVHIHQWCLLILV